MDEITLPDKVFEEGSFQQFVELNPDFPVCATNFSEGENTITLECSN